MLEKTILTALFSSFFISFIGKVGFREYCQIYAPKLISEMFNCDFCISFWCNVFVCLFFYTLVESDSFMLICPFFATALTKKIL